MNLIPMDPFYLGAYWGSRRESSLRCGERLAGFVARLGQIDEVLGSWFRRSASKAAAKTPVDLDPESLGRLLAQGQNRRDMDGDVIEELGLSFGLWNRASPAVGMSGTVGAHPSFPGVLNSFVLEQLGLDQMLYDRYPGAQSANGGFNKIRGVSPSNLNRDFYMRSARDFLERMGLG